TLLPPQPPLSPSRKTARPRSQTLASAPPWNPHRLQGGMSRRWSRTIYVGNLPGDIREREVEDLFYKVLQFISVIML
uniref:RRM domain-containing protein n=1 Tax=Aegilops tauschii subsp. strangulata TaxID=200361 RepID=A0A453I4B8_AEGTS